MVTEAKRETTRIGAITRTDDKWAIQEWIRLAAERKSTLLVMEPGDVYGYLTHSNCISSFLIDDVDPERMQEATGIIEIMQRCSPRPRCVVLINDMFVEAATSLCSGYHNVMVHMHSAENYPAFDYLCWVSTADEYISEMKSLGFSIPVCVKMSC